MKGSAMHFILLFKDVELSASLKMPFADMALKIPGTGSVMKHSKSWQLNGASIIMSYMKYKTYKNVPPGSKQIFNYCLLPGEHINLLFYLTSTTYYSALLSFPSLA